jgi:hypothetical protein
MPPRRNWLPQSGQANRPATSCASTSCERHAPASSWSTGQPGPTSGEGTESGSSVEDGRESVDPRLSLTEDAERQDRAAKITSTFENATLELQYDYAENIGDGLGITAGRAGFTSNTGDLLLLVRRYTEMKPDNPLAPYIPALEAVEAPTPRRGWRGSSTPGR